MPDSLSTDNVEPTWKKMADDLSGDPLSTTRAVADKWTTILSALVGLTTIFGLIQGRDALSKLSTGSQIVLVCLFLLALFVSVIAIYLAALAQEGSPEQIFLDKEHFFDWYNKATKRAITQLRLSRQLAFVSLGLIVIAYLFSWLAPGPPSTAINILALQKSGTFVCGTLKSTKANTGSVSLTSNGETITLNDVISFTVVSSCP
jgi:hypothetical protein